VCGSCDRDSRLDTRRFSRSAASVSIFLFFLGCSTIGGSKSFDRLLGAPIWLAAGTVGPRALGCCMCQTRMLKTRLPNGRSSSAAQRKLNWTTCDECCPSSSTRTSRRPCASRWACLLHGWQKRCLRFILQHRKVSRVHGWVATSIYKIHTTSI